MPQPSIIKICLKITYLKFHSDFPEASELKVDRQMDQCCIQGMKQGDGPDFSQPMLCVYVLQKHSIDDNDICNQYLSKPLSDDNNMRSRHFSQLYYFFYISVILEATFENWEYVWCVI